MVNDQEIRNLRNEGYTLAEISKKLNIDEITVYNAVNQDNKIITEEQRAKMITLRAAGHSYREIADIIGCSESTVRNRIKAPAKYRAPTNYYKITDHELKNIKQYYIKGKTISWIADKYGVTTGSILTRLRNAGIYQHDLTKEVPLSNLEKLLIKYYSKIRHKSIDYIADKIGRLYTTISDYLDVFDRVDS